MSAASLQPNGPGAAAILAAGAGAFALGVLTVAADKVSAIKSFANWYTPAGPLSGVTTMAVLVWLAVWVLLHARWKSTATDLRRVNAIAFTLLALGLLLTFPPVVDLF